MPRLVTCSNGHKLNVSDDLAGRKVRCPKCKEVLVVPAGDQVTGKPVAPRKPREDEVTARRQPARGAGSQEAAASGREKARRRPRPEADAGDDADSRKWRLKAERKKGRGRALPIVLVVVVLLLLGGAAGAYFLFKDILWPDSDKKTAGGPAGGATQRQGNRKPTDEEAARDTANRFLSAVRDGDEQNVRTLLTETANRKTQGQRISRPVGGNQPEQSFKLGAVKVDKDTAEVSVVLKLGTLEQNGALKLRRRGSSWAVYGISMPVDPLDPKSRTATLDWEHPEKFAEEMFGKGGDE
jgi:hypothetical protein